MVQYLSKFPGFLVSRIVYLREVLSLLPTLYKLEHLRDFPFQIFPTRSLLAFARGQVIPPPTFMTYPGSPAYTTVQYL